MRCAHCIMGSHVMCRGGDCTCTNPIDGMIDQAMEPIATAILEHPTDPEPPPPPRPKRQPRDPWICICVGSAIDGWGECQTCHRPWIKGHSPERPEGGNPPLT